MIKKYVILNLSLIGCFTPKRDRNLLSGEKICDYFLGYNFKKSLNFCDFKEG